MPNAISPDFENIREKLYRLQQIYIAANNTYVQFHTIANSVQNEFSEEYTREEIEKIQLVSSINSINDSLAYRVLMMLSHLYVENSDALTFHSIIKHLKSSNSILKMVNQNAELYYLNYLELNNLKQEPFKPDLQNSDLEFLESKLLEVKDVTSILKKQRDQVLAHTDKSNTIILERLKPDDIEGLLKNAEEILDVLFVKILNEHNDYSMTERSHQLGVAKIIAKLDIVKKEK